MFGKVFENGRREDLDGTEDDLLSSHFFAESVARGLAHQRVLDEKARRVRPQRLRPLYEQVYLPLELWPHLKDVSWEPARAREVAVAEKGRYPGVR